MIQAVDLDAAHRHSSRHRSQIEASRDCGCFYCLGVFPAAEVERWLDESRGGQTAFCPRCGIDSVLGDASGLTVTDPVFLTAMHGRWFGQRRVLKLSKGPRP